MIRERLAIRVMRFGDCAVKLPECETAQVSVPKLCSEFRIVGKWPKCEQRHQYKNARYT
jgi:hypothetical protein